jgi:hypothetical protein
MRSNSTTLVPGTSLEESALTSFCVDRFFLRVEEKSLPLHGGHRWSPPTWPLRVCTASSPSTDEELASSMERQGRHTRAACWDGSYLPLRNLTLLAGAADSTKEDGRGCGRRSSLQNLPLESRGCDGDEAATETRNAEAGEGDRRPKAGQSVY